MEDPISIFKILQDQFSEGLRNSMLEIEMMKHTIDGDSSFCTALVNSYQHKIKPLVTTLINTYAETHKNYTEMSMKLNNMASQKEIYEKSFNIISSSYKEMGKQCMKLWNAVAFALQIAQSTIQQHKTSYSQNIQMNKKYQEVYKENMQLRKQVQFFDAQMQEMLHNQSIIDNSVIAFNSLQDAANKNNERMQREFQQQIQSLREGNEQIQQSFHEKELESSRKINELEMKERELLSQIETLNNDKNNLQNTLEAKNKELDQMPDVVSRNSALETAIQEFCQHFTFINFDGHKFECKLEDFTTENISQFEHDNLRKQNAKLQQNNSELRRKISELRTSNEEQVKKLTQDHSDENRAKEHDITILEKKINQLNRERNELQSRLTDIQIDKKKADATISDLNDQLLSLKQRMQQTKNREEKINSRNEDREQYLSILNFRKPGPLVNMFAPPTNFGDAALKESNDLLRKQKQELEVQVSEMQSKISKLESMVAGNNMILELEEANRKVLALESLNRTMQQQKDLIKRKFKERIAELESENKTLQEQQNQVNNESHPPPDIENPPTVVTTADQKEDEILNDENSDAPAQNEEQTQPEQIIPEQTVPETQTQVEAVEQKPDEEEVVQSEVVEPPKEEEQKEEEVPQQEEKVEETQETIVEQPTEPAKEETIEQEEVQENQPEQPEETHEEANEETIEQETKEEN